MKSGFSRLIINVGGTRFETTRATIESKDAQETMLSMLLKHHEKGGEELFIDRTPRFFEWVLHWYRTGILVDHKTVGVPEEVWDAELDFYLIKPEAFDQERAQRYTHYQSFMQYFVDHMTLVVRAQFTFLANKTNANVFPDNYPKQLQFTEFDFLDVYFEKEFRPFCLERGYDVFKQVFVKDWGDCAYAKGPAMHVRTFKNKHDACSIIVTKK